MKDNCIPTTIRRGRTGFPVQAKNIAVMAAFSAVLGAGSIAYAQPAVPTPATRPAIQQPVITMITPATGFPGGIPQAPNVNMSQPNGFPGGVPNGPGQNVWPGSNLPQSNAVIILSGTNRTALNTPGVSAVSPVSASPPASPTPGRIEPAPALQGTRPN